MILRGAAGHSGARLTAQVCQIAQLRQPLCCRIAVGLAGAPLTAIRIRVALWLLLLRLWLLCWG